MGPVGMPKPVVEKLQNAFAEAMKSKAFLDVMDKFDMPPAYLGSEALTTIHRQGLRRNGRIDQGPGYRNL